MELTLERESAGVLCERCLLADNPFLRLKGLFGRSGLEESEGLLLMTSSIHTHFMRFPIDAVFLDRDLAVQEIVPNLKPWRVARRRGTHAVLELAAGTAEAQGLELHERLSLVKRDAARRNGATGAGPEQAVRVALATRDRRFMRVASFLLARHGFHVDARQDPAELLKLVERGRTNVVILDGSDSLAAAARATRAIHALDPSVGVVLVAESPRQSSHLGLPVLAKWSSFEHIVAGVERVHSSTLRSGLLASERA